MHAFILVGLVHGALAQTAPDEQAVAHTLQTLVHAMEAGDTERFAAQFDVDRMAEEMRRAGTLPPLEATEELGFRDGLRQGLSLMAGQWVGTPLTWKELRLQHIEWTAQGREARVIATVKIAGTRLKFRFWLVRDAQAWKVYDFESLVDGVRFSVAAASVAAATLDDDPEWRRITRASTALQRASRAVLAGDARAALDIVGGLDRDGLPAVLASRIELLEGAALVDLERYAEALAALDRALQLQEDLPLALYLKGAACLGLERYRECIFFVAKYLQIVGPDADAWLTVGAAHEGLEEPEDAIVAYRQGIASDPEDYDNRYNLATVLLEHGDESEAGRLFVEACRHAPDSEEYFDGAAAELDTAEADAELLALCAAQALRTPQDPDIFYYRGVVLRRLGRYEESEKALRAGLERDVVEEHPAYWDELAMTLAHLGQADEALTFADRLLRDSPEWGWAHYVRGYVLVLAGRKGEALQAFDTALGMSPWLSEDFAQERAVGGLAGSPEGQALLQRVRAEQAFEGAVDELLGAEDWDGLRQLAGQRVGQAPDDADAFYFHAVALRHLQRYAEAERAYRQGLGMDLESERPLYWRELGFTLAHLQRWPEALEFAAKLEALEDWRTQGLYVRLYVRALEPQTAAAVEVLRRLLQEAPEYCVFVEDEAVFEALRGRPEVRALLVRAKTTLDL